MITITTKPVYSKPASQEDILRLGMKLPAGYATLSQHQAETLEAIRNPDIEVIFNTAMTGDGKSLAAYLPMLTAETNGSALAMYPTKALIDDQLKQVNRYQQTLGTSKTLDYMDADRLDALGMLEYIGKRGEAIAKATEAEILLTNPDIFHYIMTFRYFDIGKASEYLIQRIIRYYATYIFDEFHVFQNPQIVAVLNAMLYIYHQTRKTMKRKFIFLSATPTDMLCEKLQRSGMSHVVINGEYQHSNDPIPNWRKILNRVTVHFVQLTDNLTIETWVRENSATILEFYETHPGAKGAIIVNSPMTAKRLKKYFHALQQRGECRLSVAENTGLTKDADSFSQDLLIGTSTVDIGVDFEINLLIFESGDEGTFIQRLGRLGRHDGYTKNGERIIFQEFVAYAMLPRYSYERLETKLQHMPTTELDRETLLQLVKGEDITETKPLFSSVTEFKRYTLRWGILQTAHVLQKTREIKSQQPFAEELAEAYQRVFGVDMEKIVKRYWAMQHDDCKAIFEEVMSFRGSSPFDCGIYDTTDHSIKTYHLFQILANSISEPIDKEEFEKLLEQRNISTRQYEDVVVRLRVTGYIEERENFTLQLRHDLADCEHDYFHKVMVMKGFQLDLRYPWINDINRTLRKRPVICILSKEPRNVLKMRYKLPRLFAIYTVKDETDTPYSVAFGKDALLLETILRHVDVKDECLIV